MQGTLLNPLFPGVAAEYFGHVDCGELECAQSDINLNALLAQLAANLGLGDPS